MRNFEPPEVGSLETADEGPTVGAAVAVTVGTGFGAGDEPPPPPHADSSKAEIAIHDAGIRKRMVCR